MCPRCGWPALREITTVTTAYPILRCQVCDTVIVRQQDRLLGRLIAMTGR